MMMHNPPHPGEVLKTMVLEPLGLTVTEAAKELSISRSALSRVLSGKAAISPELAIRLEKAGESTARTWVNMQATYDLWKAMQHKQPKVGLLRKAAGKPSATASKP